MGRTVILSWRVSEIPSKATAVGFVLVFCGHESGGGFPVVVEANGGVECCTATLATLRWYEQWIMSRLAVLTAPESKSRPSSSSAAGTKTTADAPSPLMSRMASKASLGDAGQELVPERSLWTSFSPVIRAKATVCVTSSLRVSGATPMS